MAQHKIRITKEFSFETAHTLYGYDGLCKHVHGHSYKLLVTVMGTPISDISNTKVGMVMDFGDLKKIVKTLIVDVFDHSWVVNERDPQLNKLPEHIMFDRIITVPYQPTSENMLIHFADMLQKALPEYVNLKYMRLNETSTSYAEWFADDQVN